MVPAAAIVIAGLKRSFGGFRLGRHRLRHCMVAWHRRRRRRSGHRLAHAVHGCRLGGTSHRQRRV